MLSKVILLNSLNKLGNLEPEPTPILYHYTNASGLDGQRLNPSLRLLLLPHFVANNGYSVKLRQAERLSRGISFRLA